MAVAYALPEIRIDGTTQQAKERHLRAVPFISPDQEFYSGTATWTLIQETDGYNISCSVDGKGLPIVSRSFNYGSLADRLYGMLGAGKAHADAVEFARVYSPGAEFAKSSIWTGHTDNVVNERARKKEDLAWAEAYIALNSNKK